MIAYASMLGNSAHASVLPKRRYYKNVISETLYSSQSVIPVMTSGSVPSGSVASNISNMTCTLAAYVLWSQQYYYYHPYYNTGSKYNKYTFASPIAAGRYRLSFSFNNSGSSSVPDHMRGVGSRKKFSQLLVPEGDPFKIAFLHLVHDFPCCIHSEIAFLRGFRPSQTGHRNWSS